MTSILANLIMLLVLSAFHTLHVLPYLNSLHRSSLFPHQLSSQKYRKICNSFWAYLMQMKNVLVWEKSVPTTYCTKKRKWHENDFAAWLSCLDWLWKKEVGHENCLITSLRLMTWLFLPVPPKQF